MLLAERPFSSSEFQRLTFKITGKQALCLQVYFEPIGSASESVGTNERAASRRVLGSTGDNASKCRLDVWTEMSMDLDVLPGIAWQAIAFKVRARRARAPCAPSSRRARSHARAADLRTATADAAAARGHQAMDQQSTFIIGNMTFESS